MWQFLNPSLLIVLSIVLPCVSSQCNPLTSNTTCSPARGFESAYSIDFTSVSQIPSEWIVADYENVTLGSNGAAFAFNKRYDAPYIWTDKYLFFGHVEVVMKCATGTGIISSAVLMSDDLDEIDYEFSGNNFGQGHGTAQTNYFGKGVVGYSTRGTYPAVADPINDFHTWTFDWSPSQLSWGVDGTNLRTLNAADCQNFTGSWFQYPQTPARLHLGLWDAGDADVASGTVYWAGGYTNLSQAPFTMYVKSVKIEPMFPGYAYNYTNLSSSWPGKWTDIQIVNTTNNTNPASTSSSAPATVTSTIKPILNPSGVTGTVTSEGSTLVTTTVETINSSSTTSTLKSVTATYVIHPTATPTKVQPGIVSNCDAFYQVVAGDSCVAISEKCGISMSDLLAWNPDVGADCYNLWLNYYQCVGISNETLSNASSSATNAGTVVTSETNATVPSNASGTSSITGSSGTASNFSTTPGSSTGGSAAPSGVSTAVSASATAAAITSSVLSSSESPIVHSSPPLTTSSATLSNSSHPAIDSTSSPPASAAASTPASTVASTLTSNQASAPISIPLSTRTSAPLSPPLSTASSTALSTQYSTLSSTSSSILPSTSSSSSPATTISSLHSSASSGAPSSVSGTTLTATSSVVSGNQVASTLSAQYTASTVATTSPSPSSFSSSSRTMSSSSRMVATTSSTTPIAATTSSSKTSTKPSTSSQLPSSTSSPSQKMTTSMKLSSSSSSTPHTTCSSTSNTLKKSSSSTHPAITITSVQGYAPAPTSSPASSPAWLDWLKSIFPGLNWRYCPGSNTWSFIAC